MQESLSNSSTEKVITDSGLVESLCDDPLNPSGARLKTSTLIEFPGTTRPLPEWRKQLSQRVREVQERRAREAAEEAAAAQEAGTFSCALPSAQLELVPSLEQTVMNPIVSKALERLERARRPDQVEGGFAHAATAAAFEPIANGIAEAESLSPDPVEIKTKLTVVASAKPRIENDRKPVRVISDSVDDVALSYLETCLALPAIAADTNSQSARFGRRIFAGSLDLLLVGLMAAPAAAAIEFSDGNWSDPRVVGLMSGITVAVMFAYFTISIALTGKTLAMRMFSLRTIDLRTGLIPTGGQSMKRAIGYIFALALLGLGLIYALVDPDRRTIYDRFSKTIVIRD
ncbi:MAG: hypothetical protein QOH71_2732 [Blastocatellia bacterium]|jgi:uncharacterized RDD family membrane protein YckC|nr:hypothetical protein [Blastocatellia bacterium]